MFTKHTFTRVLLALLLTLGLSAGGREVVLRSSCRAACSHCAGMDHSCCGGKQSCCISTNDSSAGLPATEQGSSVQLDLQTTGPILAVIAILPVSEKHSVTLFRQESPPPVDLLSRDCALLI